MRLTIFHFTLFFLIGNLSSTAQDFLKTAKITTSTGFIVSTNGTNPFLLRSNQYGLVPYKSNIAYLNGNIRKEYDSLYTINRKLKPFNYGYGIEIHANIGKVNQMLLPVVYSKVRFKAFELYAGRRREIQGLVDTLGTIGSFIWSGNALPMPKVEISIPNFTPVLGHGLISIKGNFAHGWFGNGDSVQKVWLHQKSFYAKIGKANWKIHLIGGFNHQVMWGGYPSVPFYDYKSKETISKFGSSFPTFLKVVSGVSLNRHGNALITPNGVPSNEAINRAGNHLGTIDLGIDINLPSFWKAINLSAKLF